MSRFFQLGSLLKRHPFLTNSMIYGTLYVGAEYSQQLFNKQQASLQKRTAGKDANTQIDYSSLGRYAVMGTFCYAPTLFVWYKWLDSKYQGTARNIILRKIILDQFLLTPYLLVMFFIGMSLMEGANEPFEELKQKFVPTFMRSCAFWLPVQTFNFVIVPPRFRVIFMGAAGFIWINILCLIKRQRYNNEQKAAQEKSN